MVERLYMQRGAGVTGCKWLEAQLPEAFRGSRLPRLGGCGPGPKLTGLLSGDLWTSIRYPVVFGVCPQWMRQV